MVLKLKTAPRTTVDKIIRILAVDIKCYFWWCIKKYAKKKQVEF